MSQRKKIKKFTRLEDTCYTNWFGHSDEFECEVCNEPMMYLQKKCPDCGTTYKFEKAVMELYKPVVVKRSRLPDIHQYEREPTPIVKSPSFKQWLYSGLGWKESGGEINEKK